MARRITKADITTIALCRRGKNGMRTLLKADGTFEMATLVKALGDNELLSVVYAPERPDDDGDYAEAGVIKAFAHNYLRDHRLLDIEHDGKVLAKSAAYVAESFIVAKGDERFANWKDYEGGLTGDLTGAWATLIKLEDPALQKAYRDGELDGVSMFGKAAVEQTDTQAAAKRVAEKLGKSQGTNMNKDELLAALSAFKTDVTTMVKSALTEALTPKPTEKKDEKATLTAPVFKGSATDAKALESYLTELRTYELNKSIADGTITVERIQELQKALGEGQPSDTEAGIEKADNDEVKGLKRQLFKAQKARNTPERKTDSENEGSETELAKANFTEGLAIAKCVNDRRGVTTMKVVSSNG